MIIVDIKKSGSIDRALKDLKRKFIKIGIIKELRDRQSYKKKSVLRRDELKKAKYIQKLRDTDAQD